MSVPQVFKERKNRGNRGKNKIKNNIFYDAPERIHTFNIRFEFKAKTYMM